MDWAPVGGALDLIGLAGVPGDWETWNRWLGGFTEGQFRSTLVIAGTLLIASTLPWRHWLARETPRNRAVLRQQGGVGTQAIQSSPGALQAGRDIILGEQSIGARERCKRAFSSAGTAAAEARTAITPEGFDRGRGNFLQSINEIARAAGELRESEDVLNRVADLRRRSAAREFSRPEFDQLLGELRGAIDSLPLQENGIEVRIEPDESSFIGLLPAHTESRKHTGTLLNAALDHIKVINHDRQSTTIDRMWLKIEGLDLVSDYEHNELELKGDIRVPARESRLYELRVTQLFQGRIDVNEGPTRCLVCVKAIGFPVHCKRLDKRLFITTQGRSVGSSLQESRSRR